MDKNNRPIFSPRTVTALLTMVTFIAPAAFPQPAGAQQDQKDDFIVEFEPPPKTTPSDVAKFRAITYRELTEQDLRELFPDITQKDIEDALARYEYIKRFLEIERELMGYYLKNKNEWSDIAAVKEYFSKHGMTLTDKQAQDVNDKIFHAKLEAGHQPRYIPPPPLEEPTTPPEDDGRL